MEAYFDSGFSLAAFFLAPEDAAVDGDEEAVGPFGGMLVVVAIVRWVLYVEDGVLRANSECVLEEEEDPSLRGT